MSKTSPKQQYTQLMSWLSTRGTTGTSAKKRKNFSKAEHRNKINKHYGAKSN